MGTEQRHQMKVVSLIAENIKKIRAVEITPRGDVVQITGRNGQGKSSVIDSLWWALAGAKHIQAVPIRQGADSARIKLDLGELIVERRFTADKSTLTVTSAAGARYPSPQNMLDALIGALAFDPLAFVGQEPRQQFEALRSMVDLDVDLDEIERRNRADYERRTDVNRDAKARRAQADGIAVPEGLPAEPVDTTSIKDALASAAKTNAAFEAERTSRRRRVDSAELGRRAADSDRARAQRLRMEADELDANAARVEDEANLIYKQMAALPVVPADVDVDELRASLDAGERINAGLTRREQRERLIVECKALEDESRLMTDSMALRTKERDEAIARAAMPVTGLAFGDAMVTFNGIPFAQASTAEQLRVSVAIAMAANPKLRVIRIKEGSLLDAENLQLIADMAREHDYQVWIERVDSSGQVGITIEDGSVVAVDGQPVGARQGDA